MYNRIYVELWDWSSYNVHLEHMKYIIILKEQMILDFLCLSMKHKLKAKHLGGGGNIGKG